MLKFFNLTFVFIVLSFPVQAELSINPFPLGQGKSAEPTDKPVPLMGEPAPVMAPVVSLPSQASEWKAPRGASARDVLNLWSQDAGVQMIWHTYDDYDVVKNIKLEGTYEEAIAVLLNQYVRNYIRPVGNLHIDPQTGQKTLVVMTHEGS